jgi:hypothetical protein
MGYEMRLSVSLHLSNLLVGSSEGILPLWTDVVSTKNYIERGADWCGLGKINSFLRGTK